jgi:hypothetical protein
VPAESGGWDPEAVLAAVMAKKSRGGTICWVKMMPDHIQETVGLLDEIAIEDHHRINHRAELRRQIVTVMGEEESPSREAIGRHFRGECACAIYEQ